MDIIFWLLVFITTVISSTGALYLYFMNVVYNYWKKKGVPQLKPTFLVGNVKDLLTAKKNIGEAYTDLYRQSVGYKYVGIYQLHKPTLLIIDPEIVKHILVKDFEHFHDHGPPPNTDDLFGENLFSLTGKRWKKLRTKMTPTFTSGKIKMMFETMAECALELRNCLENAANQDDALEMKDLMARYTTDIIASCAFGIQCNCLKNPNAEFRQWGRKIFEPTTTQKIKDMIVILVPKVAELLKIPFFPPEVSNFFVNAVKETIEYREKNNVMRNDFMQLLIQLKNHGTVENKPSKEQIENDKLSISEVASQAFMFFFAGYESSSSTLSFLLYELAINPDIQTEIQNELDAVVSKYNFKITYEAVMEMTFLEKAIYETLRKYPTVTMLNRDCTKDYKIPDADIIIEKGTPVIIPTLALQNDPQYYPNPEKFDPQNFNDENKAKRPYCSYLPFGEGPRICIGMRFGMMQMKIGMAFILTEYEVHVCEKTPIPMVFDPKSFILYPKGGFWLQVKKRIK